MNDQLTLMSSQDEAFARWSQLPDELLALIIKRLTTLSDVIRFSAVCRAWEKTVVTQEENLLAPGPPSLLLPAAVETPRRPVYDTDTAFFLYSPFNHQQPYLKELRIPDVNWIAGGSLDGWLLYISNSFKLHLYNPLLQRQIHLPLPASSWITKAALSRNCGGGGQAFAVMATDSSRKVALAKPGDTTWRIALCQDGCEITDVICYKGKFHALAKDWRLFTLQESEDKCGLEFSFIVKRPLAYKYGPRSCLGLDLKKYFTDEFDVHLPFRMLLVESSRGELLLVIYNHCSTFHVFKIIKDKEGDESYWMEVESLGEDAIFLSDNVSATVSATGSAGYKKNCIYISAGTLGSRNRIDIFSMEEKCKEKHIFDSSSPSAGKRRESYYFHDIPGYRWSRRLSSRKDQCHWLLDRLI